MAFREPTGESDPRAAALEVLGSLTPAPTVDPDSARDPQRLAEILLANAEAIRALGGPRLLDLLLPLLIEPLMARARDLCVRERFLLDLEDIAVGAVVHMIADRILDVRARPFDSWMEAAVESVARREAALGEAPMFRAEPSGGDPARLAEAVCVALNRLPLPYREVAWMFFVEKAGVPEIARRVQRPFEQVEFLITTVLESARRAVAEQDDERRSRRARGAGDGEEREAGR